MLLNQLVRPVNKDHSIKVAVVNVFLASQIFKPERFQQLINTDLKDRYQKFDTISSFKFNISGKQRQISSEHTTVKQNVGFKFSSFLAGQQERILKGTNEETRSFLSFQHFNYSRWANFYSNCIEDLSALLSIQEDFFVLAYGLQYVDEFIGLNAATSRIDQSMLFSTESEYLPKAFFNGYPSNFSIVVDSKNQSNDLLEIRFEHRIRQQISIIHNFVKRLEEPASLKELIKSLEFQKILDDAHSHNKDLLKTLLTSQALKMINLT